MSYTLVIQNECIHFTRPIQYLYEMEKFQYQMSVAKDV
jgi:hypothetical protein